MPFLALWAGKLGLQSAGALIKAVAISLAVLAVILTIYLTYRHIENVRHELVASAQKAAISDLTAKLNAASLEAQQRAQLAQQAELARKAAADALAQDEFDATFAKIDDLPLDLPAPAAPVSPAPKDKPHAPAPAPVDPVLALDHELNRMLERASAF